MRYAQGGGLSAEGRVFREGIRLAAGERFVQGEKTAVIAKDLRVSVRSVERWRRAWREGGLQALESGGPAHRPKLTGERFAVLEELLAQGPAVHGWADQRWTLARVKTLIGRRFHLTVSVAGIWRLLRADPSRCRRRPVSPMAVRPSWSRGRCTRSRRGSRSLPALGPPARQREPRRSGGARSARRPQAAGEMVHAHIERPPLLSGGRRWAKPHDRGTVLTPGRAGMQ
ncbi:helix-turn-helix domain-containing protein [Streptomyces sp. DSM 41602]|uniref:Helix-turn-helix domain-containing protein n=1 Tax=Streptomyces antimycoticus TaxID=68175 RepID=A0ABD5JGZ9_9ACTN|nr:helix-turn-helix domain-containing protein [Streptomyces violaceusniger]MEE4587042.1 helix-turn-helix domain-containing protein [Streptomyces sp. DSM 41602]